VKLSKSLYTRGLQCNKSLWLKKHREDLLTKPNASQKAVFATGDAVGDLACELFPDGKEIPFKGTSFEEKIALTKQWLNDGVKNIYEATFVYDGVLVMVDILHVNSDKSVEIYEVKSSTSVKPVYLDDASIQYYVLNGLGYDVKTTSIVHINNKYIRADRLEIEKLFTIADVSNEVQSLQETIPLHLKAFKTVLSNKEEPDIEIGKQCDYPYQCDAKAYCWKHIPEYSVFDITRINSDKKFSMYKDGIVQLKQIQDISSFTKTQQIQIQAEQENKTIINKKAIKKFLDGLSYPLYHLDFETFQQAIPQWKGVSSFEQIPFQYSLHVEQENHKLTQHYEFLAKEGVDPRYTLAKRLVTDIPTDVTVLAYNMGFEKGVIKQLANLFDEFTTPLMKIHDNIQDLMTPFQKKDYYTPAMKGSHSIKHVLPALVPKMEKAYQELEYIHNGNDAMQIYPKLAFMEDKQEVAKLREALLRYCELDTLAMVEILAKLRNRVEERM